MTNVQKNEILQLIEDEKVRLGSYRAVAKKCNISEATISQLRSGTYLAEGDDVYMKIALALDYSFDNSGWNIATDTTDFKIITEVLNDAKSESMFIGISEIAGIGKTSTSDVFLSQHRKQGVFKLNCKEWAGRIFLLAIAREIGATIPSGYASTNALIDNIAEACKRMAHLRPLILIDQANSLKSSALCTLIHLFNECEDLLGLVVIGTENLEIEIKRGVRLNKKGFDELDSRFGRKYIKAVGATLNDTRKICAVNGITDKELQDQIFKACEPTLHTLSDGTQIRVIRDKRRLKRVIKRERLNHK